MYKQSSLFDASLTAIPISERIGQSVTKTCKTCGKTKPDSEFKRCDGRHRATRNRCKVCHRKLENLRNKLKREHVAPPPGLCPLCNQHTDKWVLDHCHVENVFRGYICSSCNAGIGLLHDDPEVLSRAVIYLTKNEIETTQATN